MAYGRYFPTTSRDLLCRYPAGRPVPPLPGARSLLYHAAALTAETRFRHPRLGRHIGLIRLRREDHLDLNSDAFLAVVRRHRIVFVQDWFFRNAENCVRHRDVIRAYFTPWADRLARASAAVERARARGGFVVGVHVRGNDYRTFKDGRFYYRHGQYRALMEGLIDAFSGDDVAFLVCSDGPIPPDAFAGLNVVHALGDELEDLYALAGCDALVGPPSTYTTWASYYGNVPLYVVRDPTRKPERSAFEVCHGLTWDRAAVA
jgi:hypothetical protein